MVGTLSPEAYPPAAQAVFQRLGPNPDPYGIYGYEAMALALDAINRGGPTREGAVRAFFATRDRDSVLGRYSIDENGDTTLTQYGVYRIERASSAVFERASSTAVSRVSARGGLPARHVHHDLRPQAGARGARRRASRSTRSLLADRRARPVGARTSSGGRASAACRLQRLAPEKITRISRNGRHDQGVVADVRAPRMRSVQAFVQELERDGRAAARARPRRRHEPRQRRDDPAHRHRGRPARRRAPAQGVPDVGPLVIKASAGVAYRASILRAQTAEDALQALQDAGFALFGLGGEAEHDDLRGRLPRPGGVRPRLARPTACPRPSRRWVHEWIRIPMAGGVESLNVSSAATALAFELVRRAEA